MDTKERRDAILSYRAWRDQNSLLLELWVWTLHGDHCFVSPSFFFLIRNWIVDAGYDFRPDGADFVDR